MDIIKARMIGIGGFGHFALAAITASDRIESRAPADYDQELAQAKAQGLAIESYERYEDLIEKADIDGLSLSLPHYLYPPLVKLAAERGLHVYKEKPLARNFNEGLELVELDNLAS